MTDIKLPPDWKEALRSEWSAPYFDELTGFIREEYRSARILPPAGDIFNAFEACPLNAVKVVILGQDPYPTPGHAHGLCFSVNDGVEIPRSLVNIYREIADDIGIRPPASGNLTRWARQGVLLLNTSLTVRAGQPLSHRGKGWERFTDAVIQCVNAACGHVVFLLWGSPAKAKIPLIDTARHDILTAPHPSPLSASRGFFGCRHFSKANALLIQHGQTPIEW